MVNSECNFLDLLRVMLRIYYIIEVFGLYLNFGEWNDAMVHYFGLTERDGMERILVDPFCSTLLEWNSMALTNIMVALFSTVYQGHPQRVMLSFVSLGTR